VVYSPCANAQIESCLSRPPSATKQLRQGERTVEWMGGNLKQNCKLSEKKASGATLMTVGSAQFGWHWTPTAHLVSPAGAEC